MTTRVLFYVRTEPGVRPADEAATIEKMLPYVDRVVYAEPVEKDHLTVRTTSDGTTTVGYCGGLVDALERCYSSASCDTADVMVLTDQLLGPLGSLDELIENAEQSDAPVTFLFPPESSEAPTEAYDHPAAEKAGALALEPGWAYLKAHENLQLALSNCEGNRGFHALSVSLSRHGIAFCAAYTSDHDDFFARSLPSYLKAGIPFIPWRLFTEDPLVLERWSVIPRDAYRYVILRGYPTRVLWDRILHSCPPQTWYTNLGLLDIFPDTFPEESEADHLPQLRTAVIAHVFYPEMMEEILRYAVNVPAPVDLYVTTNTDEKKAELENFLAGENGFLHTEVRVVQTNRGRDVSAFLLDCADVLDNPLYDLIVKLHSKKSVQDPESISEWFRTHVFHNLLHSPGYTAHIVRRFQTEPELGMVFPPIIHMGLPTMGNGWTANRGPAHELAPLLGIDIPFDSFTPLSPYGSMFIARRTALAPLLRAGFSAEDFPDADGYRDGSVAHVLERLFSYVVFGQGYFARCAQTMGNAEISAALLEYKYDQVSHYLFPFASRQVAMLAAGEATVPGRAEVRSVLVRYARARFPRMGRLAVGLRARAIRIRGIVRRFARR